MVLPLNSFVSFVTSISEWEDLRHGWDSMPSSQPVTRVTKKLVLPVTACLAAMLSCGESLAQPASEYEVKAAFLYNFAKFVEWPAWTFEQTGGTVVLGVYGANPFGPTLERMARLQQVQGRTIVIKPVSSLKEMGFCHVLFVGSPGADGDWSQTIRAASGGSRLLVGDSDDFAQRGGGIGFFVQDRRVRFTVNLAATDRAGLKLSSKLLKIARVIRK
jgi:hypothetical protein